MDARDSGSSLVEVLMAIVLLGTAVVGILVMLRTSVKASSIDKDQATAYEYMQTVSDEIYHANRVPCSPNPGAVLTAYDTAAKAASAPQGWTKTATVTKVEFLGRALPTDPFSWGNFCFETLPLYATSPLYTQKITFTVTDPHGLVRTMQVVKSEK
jgi:type II secretory pathway pseudopilin PulG